MENNIRKKPPIFILILLVFMLVVLYLIHKIGLDFQPVSVIEYNGYAVNGKELVENLLRSDLNGKKYIEPLKIEEDDVIYKKIATYFVGEDKKTKINLDYPIYVNNNISLLNLTDQTSLITTDFEEFSGYENSTLTDGVLYNNSSDFKRADYNDYLFMKNSDKMYVNTKEIKVVTMTNTYIIPKNSIINFTEKYIAYYKIDGEVFKYQTIVDINSDSSIMFEYTEHNNNLTLGEEKSDSIYKEYLYKDFLLKLNLIRENKPVRIKDDVKEDEQKNVQKVDSEIVFVDDDNNSSSNNNVIVDNGNEINTNNQEVKIPWTKPVVRATEIVPNIYTANTKISIYDPSGVIKTAIVFEIYKNGKIFMRNQTIYSGNIRLGVLEPETEYEIVGIYRYQTEDKKTIEVEFIDQKIKTHDISGLKSLKLDFENGSLFSNKIEVSNLRIASNLNEVSETIAGVSKCDVIINGKTFNMASYDLRRILSGQSINISSQENLPSNSIINYEFRFYDLVNNLIKLENNIGESNTCMQKPQVDLVNTNSKGGVEISFKLDYINPDNVIIKNQKYIVYSVTNDIVDQGEISSNYIDIKNLQFAKYYTLKVYGDYSLNDNNPDVLDDTLGTISFATAKLEQYGDLYIDLNISQENITTDSALIDININATTNKTNIELIEMLQNVKVIVSKGADIVFEKNLNNSEFSQLKNLRSS